MKRIILITFILFIAFTVNAQNNRSRSERSQRSEPSQKEEIKRTTRSSQPARESRSAVNRSNTNKRENNSSVAPPARSRTGENAKINTAERPPRTRTYNNNGPVRNKDRNSVNTRNRTTYQNRDVQRPRVTDTNRTGNRRIEGSGSHSVAPRVYKPRTGQRYDSERRNYTAHPARRVVRPAPKTYYAYKPIEYRRIHYIYRVPPRRSIIWNIHMYNEYVRLYPDYHLWYYPMGYHIHTISAYDANRYIGDIARVYGEVYSAWYSPETDEYYLYIGGPYPYQDLTIILEGRDGRRFSRNPLRYFTGRHVAATGLISIFEGKPEMFLKKRSQITVY